MNSQKSHPCRGFTLVEALIVVLLIAALVSLSVPGLSAARRTALEVACVANARASMQMIDLYASSSKDFFPTWFSDSPEPLANPRRRDTFRVLGAHMPQTDRWLEWINMPRGSRSLYCPSNQNLKEDRTGRTAAVDYWWTDTFYIDPAYLDPWANPEDFPYGMGIRVQTRSNAVFPSAKVGVYEYEVWHAWAGSYHPKANLNDLPYTSTVGRGSVAMLDGSARAARPLSGRSVPRFPQWGFLPYDTTAWGVRGRDF